LTLFVVSAAILFDALDLSITQVGLPSIESDLQLEPATLPWVANAYVLTYGGLLLLGGRAADLVGRRRVFISGLVLFAGMSLVRLGPDWRSVDRGAWSPGGRGSAHRSRRGLDHRDDLPRGRPAQSCPRRVRRLCELGFAVGLVLGGVVTDVLDWRWIFLVKVPAVSRWRC